LLNIKLVVHIVTTVL